MLWKNTYIILNWSTRLTRGVVFLPQFLHEEPEPEGDEVKLLNFVMTKGGGKQNLDNQTPQTERSFYVQAWVYHGTYHALQVTE